MPPPGGNACWLAAPPLRQPAPWSLQAWHGRELRLNLNLGPPAESSSLRQPLLPVSVVGSGL